MAHSADPPFHPIVYVRGYAGNDAEVDDTAADPYMGFNLGATAVRQDWQGKVFRHFFESPLLRLMKEHDYQDIYHQGEAMPSGRQIPYRSVFIYRYYDDVSNLLGAGVRPEIETYAQGLETYLKQIRDRICGDDEEARKAFRVYLVAHSMGGLVCRCFLQKEGSADARSMVDKVFTYATPHNGIDLQVLGNVPGLFSRNNSENFNRQRMRTYLGLPKGDDEESVASLNGAFDPDRFFCLVGTNHKDYQAAAGWARRVVGPMSDGLVRIANAAVHGPWKEVRSGNQRKTTIQKHAPRAFVHRSHSGYFGIVNSEDGYQNMARFLFGDMRVDGLLRVKELTLPPEVARAHDEEDREIRASYHFDAVVRVRQARWDLSRRRTDEGSAVFRKFDEMFPREAGQSPRHPHLFSTYLALWARGEENASMGFSLDLAVHVPEYEVDGLLWMDDHFAGGTLYREKLNFELWPPEDEKSGWRLLWGRDSVSPNRAETPLESRDPEELDDLPKGFLLKGDTVYVVPVRQDTRPGIDAELVLRARPWS